MSSAGDDDASRARRPRFSERTAWELEDKDIARVIAAARAKGVALADLTESNPTRCGLGDLEASVALLGHPRGARYEPEALGHPETREAVARYYADRGIVVKTSSIAITASTSEAYAFLFKLLTERGD